MDILHAILLALIQGITEFLPISSSAHLILLPLLSGWEDQGLVYDVAAHVGTLVAVLLYFRRDLHNLTHAWIISLLGGPATAASRMMWYVLLGTIPVGLAGLLLHGVVSTALRSPLVIAATTIGFALLLWYADASGRQRRGTDGINLRDALIIGLAQALALVPGTSRSGITITAGLLLGLTRTAAARFSFLLAIPVTILAGVLEARGLLQAEIEADWVSLAAVALLSFASAYLCIHYFLKLVERIGMLPFVIYRLLLGGFLLWQFA